MSLRLNPITVDNADFLITSMIERCPKTMMIRELFKNAEEAAAQAEAGDRRIEFGITYVGPRRIPKLTIWNTGPGMDDGELSSMTNLAASLGKTMGLDANFGMGAKVASLPSNKLGLRYRSCKNGRVHEVLLGYLDGAYGRLKRFTQAGDLVGDVVDVTDTVMQEGLRSLEDDWTEVVLVGNRPDQNTVLDPYDNDPPVQKMWLAVNLYHRFYRLHDGVEVKMLEGTHKLQDGNRSFETIPQRLRFFAKNETVTTESGLKIHYLYDEKMGNSGHNRSISGSIATDNSTGAVIFKDEMYDVLIGRKWSIVAPEFGITFGAKHISVHVELPSDYPCRPDAYREFLRRKDGDNSEVNLRDFTAVVHENRPEWLIELVHSLAPTSSLSTKEIEESLQQLLNKMRLKTQSPTLQERGEVTVMPDVGEGMHSVRDGDGEGAEGRKPRESHLDLSVVHIGTKMAKMAENLARAPRIIPLDDAGEVAEKDFTARAAKFYPKTGELFVNMLYPAVSEMRSQLESEYASADDEELMRRIVLEHCRSSMMRRVGFAVVFGLAKRLNHLWDEVALTKALEPESLSLAADNYYESLQDARRSIGKTLKIRRTADAED
jgi:hypothetical protein